MSERRIATVLMLDVVGSTHIAAEIGDARYRELSSRFVRIVRAALRRFGGREEDQAGDGFFATFPQPDRALRCAAAISDEVRTLGIEIRCGVHTGQTESLGTKTQGIAVVIGARVMSLAGPGEILVTSTTKELVTGSGFAFEDLSAHELKGVPGTWQVFAVTAVDGAERGLPLAGAEAAERRTTIQPGAGRRRPSLKAMIAAGLALLVAVVGIAFAITRGRPASPPRARPTAAPSQAVVQVDPEREPPILKSIPVPVPRVSVPGVTVPTSAHSMVVGQGSVWTVRFRTLFQVDPSRSELRERLTLEQGISFSVNLAEGADKIWIAYDGGLDEVNPATGEQREAFHSEGDRPVANDVTVGAGVVWLGGSDGSLVRFDPMTGRALARTGLDPIDAIAFGHGSVWTVDTIGGTVTRYDPATMRPVEEIVMPTAPDYLVSGEVAVWALSQSVGTLSRIDPATNDVRYQVQVGADPSGLAVGSGAVWVGDEDGIIRRVDEETRQVIEIPFGAEIRALAYDADTDTIWVDVL
ncbi:MAG TPA: adenylate/guanylate cyclase domain-containing protein [Actinomycetota bacterium]